MPKILETLNEYYPAFDEKIFLLDFSQNEKEQWLKEVYKTLEKSGKPADINVISWKTLDGITIPPLYDKTDLEKFDINEFPGKYPYTRKSTNQQKWEILQYLQGDFEDFQQKLEQNTRRGAEGILVPLGNNSFPFIFYGKSLDLNQKFIDLIRKYSFNYYFFGDNEELFHFLKYNSDNQATILLDYFLDYLLTGDEKISLEELSTFISNESEKIQNPFLAVRGDIYHNSGLPTAMELGFTVSHFCELLVQLKNHKIDIKNILHKISIMQSTSSYYFLEIAKFRATRRLISMVLKEFGIEDYKSPRQIAVTSFWELSIYDIYNNMLRNTVSSMAAILGGVDALIVLPISSVYNSDDEFTRRMAINTQLILKYESHFDYVVDPAGGSYYIENLTNLIASKAWEYFLQIENQGGFLESLKKNYIQELIENKQEERIRNIQSRKEFVLGVTQFPNPKDNILNEYPQLELLGIYQKREQNAKYKTIHIFRPSSLLEELRLKTEHLSLQEGTPVIQLIPFGNLAMQRARASFMINFFVCGGFIVDDPGNLKNKENIINFINQISFKEKLIKAFVLCSSDDEYLPMFNEIREVLLNTKIPVLVAGMPSTSEELKQEGIYDFIHIKSNLYDTLLKYQNLFFHIT